MLTVIDNVTGAEYTVYDANGRIQAGDFFIAADGSVLREAKDTMAYRCILKPIKWRAKEDEIYWHVLSSYRGGMMRTTHFKESRGTFANQAYDMGNYYRTPEEAQAVADKINSIFKENV